MRWAEWLDSLFREDTVGETGGRLFLFARQEAQVFESGSETIKLLHSLGFLAKHCLQILVEDEAFVAELSVQFSCFLVVFQATSCS